MTLALALGRTLHELSAMSGLEFDMWREYYIKNPWGDRREDLRAALIAQTVANHAGMRRNEPASLKDFLLDFNPKESAPLESPDPMQHFHTD